MSLLAGIGLRRHRAAGGGIPANLAYGFHFDGANNAVVFPEVLGATPIVTVQGGIGPHLDTSQAVFGSAALALGIGADTGYVSVPVAYNQRTDLWAFKARVNWSSLDGCILGAGAGDFYITGVGGTLYVGDGAANPIAVGFGSLGVTTGTEHELLVNSDGSVVRLYIDGVIEAISVIGLLKSYAVTAHNIGAGTGGNFSGFIDDAQFYVGAALYTGSSYTPQSGPF